MSAQNDKMFEVNISQTALDTASSYCSQHSGEEELSREPEAAEIQAAIIGFAPATNDHNQTMIKYHTGHIEDI